MEDKKFAEQEEQHQDPNLEVTELDDEALDDVSGGLTKDTNTTNTNCGVC